MIILRGRNRNIRTFSAWDYIRNPTLEEIKTVLHEDSSFRWDDLSPELKMQISKDITKIQKTLNIKNDCEPN